MTKQEAFEKGVRHLAAQGCVSTRNGYCAYRGPGATRCMVGFFIPDEVYHPDMDTTGGGTSIADVWAEFPGVRPHLEIEDLPPGDHIEFWERMQGIHDTLPTTSFIDRLRVNALEFACPWGLDASFIQELM